jgi:hypothetical protein
MQILLHLAVLTVTVIAVARFLPEVHVKGVGTAVVVAVVFSVLNLLLGWLIHALLIVPAVLTLGLLFFFIPFLVRDQDPGCAPDVGGRDHGRELAVPNRGHESPPAAMAVERGRRGRGRPGDARERTLSVSVISVLLHALIFARRWGWGAGGP